jgi:hypothetical protein
VLNKLIYQFNEVIFSFQKKKKKKDMGIFSGRKMKDMEIGW